jgi:UDP-N-acetylmuramate: L-alanyl-gamma-D-glutamyl-meso-diaminopimelate ligase
MSVHFIAVAGSAMHNLALALHQKGFIVTGSDDEIAEPAKSRLKQAGLLPPELGWFPEKINASTEAVILGMHARADNPELIKAQSLGIRVYSYPEYLYEQSKDKLRVVVGGSHGKTTITSMVLHVLKQTDKNFDYMVGAQVEGFNTMVKITADAPLIVLEGDEYLSSAIDRRPKFHLYQAQIALISGIAWDHINVFPTFEEYVRQFEIFAQQISRSGTLIFCQNDHVLNALCQSPKIKATKFGYTVPPYVIENGLTNLLTNVAHCERIPLQVFGEHNLMNIEGARLICEQLGISAIDFYTAIQHFKGAAKRLELIAKNKSAAVFKDFAHSPSKLKATIHAVRQQFPDRKLIACMELHTFSSLNENFLEEYKNSMDEASEAIIYFNPQTIAHKKLKAIQINQVKAAFGRTDAQVINDAQLLEQNLRNRSYENTVLLLMSSGSFDGMDIKNLGETILQ